MSGKPQTLREAFERDVATLAKLRDELRVHMNLAKADARDEWKVLEQSWPRVESELKRVGDHTKEPVKEIGQAARTLLDEIKQGYERIKREVGH